jgi:hypothetical protein
METETTSLKISFRAIKGFVNDLWYAFGTSGRPTPLSLYVRLLECVSEKESEDGLQKYISGFVVFFSNYGTTLTDTEKFVEIPRGTVIRYGSSKNVYLEIQKYIYKSNNEQKEIIRQHLLTVNATINPSEKSISALDPNAALLEKMGLNDGSQEGAFVSQIMKKAKKVMAEQNNDDPAAAITGLLTSGVITDLVKGVQSGVGGGQMDVGKLLGSLQGALSSIIATVPKKEEKDAPSDLENIIGYCSKYDG